MKMNLTLSVKFFKTVSGNEPVRDWPRDSLTSQERKIVGRDIKIVEISWPVGPPLVKPLGNGLWELRSDLGDKISRVFFAIHNSQIILLHGFIKRGQKTPVKELNIARRRKTLFKKG
jgi:phage-related protein